MKPVAVKKKAPVLRLIKRQPPPGAPLRLVKKRPDNTNIVYGLLQRYERSELEIATLKNENTRLFEELEALEAERQEALESIKRVVYSKEGPPEGVEGKFYVPAQTQYFRAELMFPQSSECYDPARLPKEILLVDGVVTGVDTDAINAWVAEHPHYEALVEPAKQERSWLSPRLSIKRL